MNLHELKELAEKALIKNESCRNCGSKEFSITRDMTSRRLCNKCPHSWPPPSEFINIRPEGVLQLIKIIEITGEALEKIADPRKRDHFDPDKYTELGCVMNIADEVLEKIRSEDGIALK